MDRRGDTRLGRRAARHDRARSGLPPRRHDTGGDVSDVVAELATGMGAFGLELVDVAGNVDTVSAQVGEQARMLTRLGEDGEALRVENAQVASSAAQARAAATDVIAHVDESRRVSAHALAGIADLVGWVDSVGSRMRELVTAVESVGGITHQIDSIARRTSILALNAQIEASRSGDAGRGFAVIADSVRQLAEEAIAAAGDVDRTLSSLTSQIRTLGEEGLKAQERTVSAHEDSESITRTVESVNESVTSISGEVSRIADAAERSGSQFDSLVADLRLLVEGAASSDSELEAARDRVNNLLQRAEQLVGLTVMTGVTTVDTKFIELAQQVAGQISALFDKLVARGETTVADLFDTRYVPVPNSDPQQHTTRFTALTDRVLPDLLEPMLDFDPRVVFTAAVDRNGYLPTHNRIFSHPQGPDPVWNAANSRNRRIFDDRTGLRAARNTEPFLLQMYRRSMGGDTFVLMKDLSAPIYVNGRHWGGLRIGYRVEEPDA